MAAEDVAIRDSLNDVRDNYTQREAGRAARQAAQQVPPAQPVVPTQTVEKSVQNSPEGGTKQVVKTTAPIRTEADIINAESTMGPGRVARVNQPVIPPAQFPSLEPSAVLERSIAGKMGRGLTSAATAVEQNVMQPFEQFYQKNIKYPVESYLSETSTGMPAAPYVAPTRPGGAGAPSTGQPVIPPYGGPVNEDRLRGGVLTQAPSQGTPGTPPTAGLDQWGISKQVNNEGVVAYTLPGGEGTMTVKPQAPGTYNDEAARRGVFASADQTRQGIIQGLETQYANQKMLDQEAFQRASSDEAMKELDMQRAAGIVPLSGMAEYEANAAKMRQDAELNKQMEGMTPAGKAQVVEAGIREREAKATAGKDLYKQYLAEKGTAVTAAAKTANEAAGRNIEMQKLGLEQWKAGSEAQKREMEMNKMVYDMGMGAQMENALKNAKNANDAAQIRLNFRKESIKESFAPRVKDLENNMELASNPDAKAKAYKALQDDMNQEYLRAELQNPTEGAQVSMPMKNDAGELVPVALIYRNGKWARQ